MDFGVCKDNVPHIRGSFLVKMELGQVVPPIRSCPTEHFLQNVKACDRHLDVAVHAGFAGLGQVDMAAISLHEVHQLREHGRWDVPLEAGHAGTVVSLEPG